MTPAKSVFFLTIILVLGLIGCSHPGCPNGTPGTTGSPSGTPSGSPAPPSSCPAPGATGNLAALVYSLAGTQLNAGGLDDAGSPFALTEFASPALPSNHSDDMVIVNKQFLYIPMGDRTIQAFTIDRSTATLTAITGSPYTAPTVSGTTDRAVTDPLGRFLFVGSEFTGELWVYKISSTTGALTLVTGSPFTAQYIFSSADSLAVDASGQFLYVGQADPTLGIMGFSIDQTTGALTQISGVPFHLGVAELHADPAAEFLLGTAQILNRHGPAPFDTHIYVFPVANNGVPTARGSAILTNYAPYDFMILQNGKYVFTFGINTSTWEQGAIEGFALDSTTGTLQPLIGSPFVGLPSVAYCKVGQSGSEAICTDSLPGTQFSVLSITSSTGGIAHTGKYLTVGNTFPFAVTN